MIGSSLLLTLEFYQYNICKRNKYLLHGEWSTAVGLVCLVPINGFFYNNHIYLNHCLRPFSIPPKKGAIRHYLCGTTELLPYAQGWSMLPIMVSFEFIVYSFQQRAIIQQHLTQIMYLDSNGNTTQRTLRPREIVGDRLIAYCSPEERLVTLPYIEWDRMQPDKIELLEAWERGVHHPRQVR